MLRLFAGSDLQCFPPSYFLPLVLDAFTAGRAPIPTHDSPHYPVGHVHTASFPNLTLVLEHNILRARFEGIDTSTRGGGGVVELIAGRVGCCDGARIRYGVGMVLGWTQVEGLSLAGVLSLGWFLEVG